MRSPSMPTTLVCGSIHCHRIAQVAHLASPGWMEGTLDMLGDEGINRCVRRDVGAGLDLAGTR